MRTSYRLAATLSFLVLAGCESEEDKTERLRTAAQDDCAAVTLHETNPQSAIPTDADRAKCETARAAYTAFLEGR
jgi:outer membrane murein-binding lipoprotein Lpp